MIGKNWINRRKHTPQTEYGPSQKVKETETAPKYGIVHFYGNISKGNYQLVTKGTFHAKMGTVKDRNGMDLTAAKILRRGGKNTQKNRTKKIFMMQITTMV